ncbi:ketohexokinase-like [Copidosoma floridanum]|uniref:ketohexokinase-like n=1 Tax=Copidosoma floridanum TaxID=29053 RepID=UPI0006C9A5B7|nr:ketohexokinase-like [Copidosoma floridanum]
MISTFYERIVGTSPPPEQIVPKILCVGLSCVDIVQLCKSYPQEDTDQSCIDFRYQRGGNASNNCTVISQLDYPCEFLGILSKEQFSKFLQDDMKKLKIDFSHCPILEDGGCPTSVVLLSMSTGSRTIIHHKQNETEITLKDLEKLSLEDYTWIHFEGRRNVSDIIQMMQHIENYNNALIQMQSVNGDKSTHLPITVSVELEKTRPELLDLLPYADVAFVSKDFSQSRGYTNMRETLNNFSQESKTGATIFSAWADRGAMARAPDGTIVQSPAFPPYKIIDTLGAGDTFNAAVIYYLNKEKISFHRDRNPDDQSLKVEVSRNFNIESSERCQTEFINRDVLQSAVVFGCRLAGAKIGLRGFDGLSKVYKNYLS